ncbi:cupin domain-containing protein [Leucobacter denitrificans]|uniref:AraC family ligand binding domain-containing protein n=1 Tax=Leucobacter denitrificans TaxID=683042 RepID=A0A7G9S5D5_9MICO|nr:AraC family ligand binding domain-containing protein [Leucobacter denitrificans]QNN63060.1 AraC family ligand binding domain-containing protein [Leucobacter denitrificans]
MRMNDDLGATVTPEVVPAISGAELTERVHTLEHILLWQTRGQADLVYGEKTVTLLEGEAAWVPARTWHSLHAGDDSITTPLFIPVCEVQCSMNNVVVVPIRESDRRCMFALWNSQSNMSEQDLDLCHEVVATVERAALCSNHSTPRTPALTPRTGE